MLGGPRDIKTILRRQFPHNSSSGSQKHGLEPGAASIAIGSADVQSLTKAAFGRKRLPRSTGLQGLQQIRKLSGDGSPAVIQRYVLPSRICERLSKPQILQHAFQLRV